MYTSEISVKVTKAMTIIITILLTVLCLFGPNLLAYFFGGEPVNHLRLTVPFYCCCPAGYTALFLVYKLMNNISKDEVFRHNTVFIIRLLSWLCLYVSVVCFVAGFFDALMWIFCIGALFLTLILRVLKNVMDKATQIKEENDMTI